jgi:hypothetical protein
MVVSLLSAACAGVFGALGCQDQGPVAPRLQAGVRIQLDTALATAADAYVRSDQPNANFGTATVLPVAQTGQTRSLLRFDTAAIRQAVGIGTLDSARLELTISFNDNNWGAAGRAINLHRLTQAWTEVGATWHCADDAVPSNQEPDCSGPTQWSMGSPTAPPFEATASAGAVITNGQSGVVALNVTADVAAVLAGSQTHYGWVLKKAAEDSAGQVRFASRESGTPPRLVLAVAQDTSRPALPATTYFYPSDTAFSVTPSDSPESRFYRTVVGLLFDDSASGVTVRSVLQRYSATIIGAWSNLGAYVIRVPDPGPSMADLDSLISRLTAELGVNFAFSLAIRDAGIKRLSRFPSDGPGRARSAWFDGSDATLAWRAIRAPLAWGCETGKYGSSPPTLGMLDETFDSTQPELSVFVKQVVRPDSAYPVRLDGTLDNDTSRSHGTAVAGILTAAADNDSGIAGMVWQSDLRVFLVARGDSIVADPVQYMVESVLPKARDRGVRILSSTVLTGDGRHNRFRAILKPLRQYLTQGGGNLFVQAVGNDSLSLDLDSLLRVNADYAFLQATAVLRDSLPERIVLVAGTASANTAWSRSNFIIGRTDIAAPAANIVSIANSSVAGGLLPARSGTSYSTPFVAGAAALVWAMEPTLPPGDVKDFLVRGSRSPRLNPRTGEDSLPREVDGWPGVYQLDAYGSLVLLARERPGTPICGYPVRVGSDLPQGSVLLESGGPSARTLSVPGVSATADISRLSVAQGGRLVGAYSNEGDPNNPAAGGSVVMNHQGTLVTPLTAGRRRVFLERDTVDAQFNSVLGYELFTFRRGDGSTPETVDLVASAKSKSPNYERTLAVEISPDGSRASVITRAITLDTCTNQFGDTLVTSQDSWRWFRVAVDGGLADSLGRRDVFTNPCSGTSELFGGGWVAWSHDGRAAVAAFSQVFTSGGSDALIGRLESDNSYVQGDFVVGRLVQAPRFTADDSLVISGEFTWPGEVCTRQLRLGQTPWEAVGPSAPGVLGADCFFPGEQTDVGGPIVPNAHTGRLRPAAEGVRPTAFHLGAPAGRLASASARWFVVASSVQAN